MADEHQPHFHFVAMRVTHSVVDDPFDLLEIGVELAPGQVSHLYGIIPNIYRKSSLSPRASVAGRVVILLNLADEFRAIVKRKTANQESSVEAEGAVLGFDHTMVGERLVEQWRMPPSLKACVRHHHAPPDAGEFETLAYIIACGDFFSHAQGAQSDGASAEHAIDLAVAQRTLDLSDEHVQLLREQIDEDFQHSDALD